MTSLNRSRYACIHKRRQRGFIIDPYRFGTASATGLLDSYTTSLWGAYSLVLLRGNYAGSAIRVRRSSDSTEQDIGFTGTALDTASLATFVGANDGFIVKWYDQSGGANDLPQATAGAQAKIVEAGTYMGEVCCDGVDDEYITANNSGTPSAFTVYMAGRDRIGAATAAGVACRHNSAEAQLNQIRLTTITDNYIGRVLCGPTGLNSFADPVAVFPATYAAVFDRAGTGIAGQCKLWRDGVEQASVATAGATTSGTYAASTWRLGSDSANFARLGLTTFLIYETAHSSGTIGSISTLIKPANKVDTLDNYTTSLWALYSLRRLRSSYAGSCIRVRRSNDNVEADIGFDGTTRLLDTAALATHVGANSGYVVTWYDQSAGGNNSTQATAANQARIVNAGVVDTAVKFDGTNDGFATTANGGTPSGLTLYFKGHITSISTTAVGLELGANSGTIAGARLLFGNVASQTSAALNNADSTQRSEYRYELAPAENVLAAVFDRSQATNAAQIDVYSGGRSVTEVSNSNLGAVPSGTFAADKWYLGARNGGASLPYSGSVETVVIYETAQTAALIETISRAIG